MKVSVNMTLGRGLLEKVDRRRGLASRSAYVEALLERALAGADSAFVPPPLRDAKVQHAKTRNPSSGQIFVDGSMVHPAKDAPGGTAPYTINHPNDTLGPGAEVREGVHWFEPAACDGCRLTLKDFPRSASL